VNDLPDFRHRFYVEPVSTPAAWAMSASIAWKDLPGSDTRKFYAPDGHEETKEEFDAAMNKWESEMAEARKAIAAARAAIPPEPTWKQRLDAWSRRR